MGNSMACFCPDKEVTRLPRQTSKKSPISSRSTKKQRQRHHHDHQGGLTGDDDLLLKQQAMAAALLFRDYQRTGNMEPVMNRSTSVVYPSPAPKKQGFGLPKSSSSRQHSGLDTVVHPRELVTSLVSFFFTEFYSMNRYNNLIEPDENLIVQKCVCRNFFFF